MLPNPTDEQQAAFADSLTRQRVGVPGREVIAEVVLSVGFVAAVALLWLLVPPGGFAVWPALACVAVLVVAARIRIDTPFGWTPPTQLAFVPLVFALPLAIVPVAVAIAMAVVRIPDILQRRIVPSRIMGAIPSSWFAIGPVAVFALAHTSPANASPTLLVAALAAEFAVDFAVSVARVLAGRRAKLVEVLGQRWIYVVDGALSGVGLLAAEQIHRSPIAALAPLPLLGLVAMFARERRQRLESLIELNAAYRDARDEAIEASNMKSAFLRNVSHEIRTPMNGVIGMTELLLQTDLTGEQQRYAEQVEQSGAHMLRIINDILDISKIETGHLELELADFDLHELVERACVPAGLEARAKGVDLDVHIDSDAPARVRGEGPRVRQVLLNLVGNAVKFTASGSITVHVRRRGPGDDVLLEVVDTGIGIDPDRVEQMFHPFVQADVTTTREYGGNGLGLAIAKELVELMGGTIGASSEPGRGSSFWVQLPLPAVAGRAPAPRPDSAIHASARRRDASPGQQALVLVVEDSPVNRLVAVHMLERCGVRVHVASDGREALEALSTQRYDAVLMDCQMPGIDGYEATRELRRRENGARHTPVIAMTAHAMTGDRDRCLEAGMDDYIAKPVRSHVLGEVLDRWIAATPETVVAA